MYVTEYLNAKNDFALRRLKVFYSTWQKGLFLKRPLMIVLNCTQIEMFEDHFKYNLFFVSPVALRHMDNGYFLTSSGMFLMVARAGERTRDILI
jgi:hypothetical protein